MSFHFIFLALLPDHLFREGLKQTWSLAKLEKLSICCILLCIEKVFSDPAWWMQKFQVLLLDNPHCTNFCMAAGARVSFIELSCKEYEIYFIYLFLLLLHIPPFCLKKYMDVLDGCCKKAKIKINQS